MNISQQKQDGVSRPLVFVVEDEEEVAALISLTLRSTGFDVQSFADATPSAMRYPFIDVSGLRVLVTLSALLLLIAQPI